MVAQRLIPFLLPFLLVSGPALADEDTELAKRYFKLGEELYNRSDYEGAVKQFEQSYQLSKKPDLLFNMARCYESLGSHEKAIDLFSQYLQSKPANPQVIETRIANLRRLIEKKRPPEVDAAGTAPPPTSGSTEPTPPPPPAEPRRSRVMQISGWTLVATGGALLITGIAMSAMASKKAGELEEANKAGREWTDVANLESSGKTFAKAGIATLVIGGAAAAAGAVLLILDSRDQGKERRAWIAPTLTAGGAGVWGQVRF